MEAIYADGISGEIARYLRSTGQPMPSYDWRKRCAGGSGHYADTVTLRRNLLDFKRIADNHDLVFMLVQGTLLGAIRDGDIFEHAIDVDLAMHWRDRERLVDLLPALRAAGFQVMRIVENDEERLLSLIRDEEYLDVHFLREIKDRALRCWHMDGQMLAAEHFDSTEVVRFLGEDFKTPACPERYLARRYGQGWRRRVYKILGAGLMERAVFAARREPELEIWLPTPWWPLRVNGGVTLRVRLPADRLEVGTPVVVRSGTLHCVRLVAGVEDGFVHVHARSPQAKRRAESDVRFVVTTIMFRNGWQLSCGGVVVHCVLAAYTRVLNGALTLVWHVRRLALRRSHG